jgi:type VI secretion system protein ImpK
MTLTDTFIDLIYFTLVNEPYGFQQFSFATMQQKYEEMVTAAENGAKSSGIEETVWRRSFFAVAVWIDEVILLSDWKEKTLWCKDTLQRVYFKTSNGGIEFFNNLEQLRSEDNQIMEIYDICLSLGFKGTYYRQEDNGILSKIINKTMQLLQIDKSSMSPSVLFPCAYRGGTKVNARKKSKLLLPYIILLSAGPVILFILLYAAFHSDLSGLMLYCIEHISGNINQ